MHFCTSYFYWNFIFVIFIIFYNTRILIFFYSLTTTIADLKSLFTKSKIWFHLESISIAFIILRMGHTFLIFSTLLTFIDRRPHYKVGAQDSDFFPEIKKKSLYLICKLFPPVMFTHRCLLSVLFSLIFIFNHEFLGIAPVCA